MTAEPPAPAARPSRPADPDAGRPAPLTPAQAFDALYAFCAPALVRQAYLLTGRRELARESVERAFQLAWQRWPEVAVDRDPAGWVRATAYEYALSPWHRFRPRHRHPEPPPADAADRALLDVLLKLPPPHRRTLLLYDGVGLDLPETAAETEASTPAAAGRLLHAREAVAARLPELADPAVLHRRLAELASTERLRAGRAPGGADRRRTPGPLLDTGGHRLHGRPDRDDGAHRANGPDALRAAGGSGRAGAGGSAAEWPRARCRRRRWRCGRLRTETATGRSGSYR